MGRNDGIEVFGTTMNDLCDNYPKSRGRCFDIGICGGCGPDCPAFLDGECDEPQEMDFESIITEHGDESQDVFKLYDCFHKFLLPIKEEI